jgi:hypothetical protein
MSVRPSYYLAARNNPAPAGRILVTYYVGVVLLKSVGHIQIYLYLHINNIHCAWRPTCAVSYLIPREISLRNTTSHIGSDTKNGSRVREVEKTVTKRVFPNENRKKVVIVFRLFRIGGVFHHLSCCINAQLHSVMLFFFVLWWQHYNRLWSIVMPLFRYGEAFQCMFRKTWKYHIKIIVF